MPLCEYAIHSPGEKWLQFAFEKKKKIIRKTIANDSIKRSISALMVTTLSVLICALCAVHKTFHASRFTRLASVAFGEIKCAHEILHMKSEQKS